MLIGKERRGTVKAVRGVTRYNYAPRGSRGIEGDSYDDES